MMGLTPIENQSPIFFGVHRTLYFKFLIYINLLQNGTCFGIVIWDIVVVTQVQAGGLDDEQRFLYRVIAWVWLLVHVLQGCVMDAFLLTRKYSSSQRYIRRYWIHHVTYRTLVAIYYYSIEFTIGFSNGNLPAWPITFTILFFAAVMCNFYTGYKTYLFWCELKFENDLKMGYRNLTEDEMLLFEKGIIGRRNPMRSILSSYHGSPYYFEKAISQAYNRSQFEIKLETLDFTESVTVGCGEFGCVYKTELTSDKIGGGRATVAVKTVDPELSDVNKFMALLTEAKVMTYVGQHENVVRLIGVCTRLIRERKLYIVSELCELGNIRGYLRTEKHTFVNMFQSPTIMSTDKFSAEPLSTNDLVRWAYEICCGMEFLAGKMIIHGDLACRNVLLSITKTAKITDFGLSRRLYSYTIYQKRTEVPLPWRWLAVESLLDLKFATYSDVWAFGICCWEMFELGTRPWPEFSHYTLDFIAALKAGQVPQMPRYCNQEIYNVMLSCWRPVPEERPNFGNLKQTFQILWENLKNQIKT